MHLKKTTRTSGNLIFERRECTNKTEEKHKLQAISNGPYQTITADATNFTVHIGNQVEKLFYKRVLEASITTRDISLIASYMKQQFNPVPTY